MSLHVSNRLLFGLTVESLFEWGYRITLLLCFIGLIYLRSIFATSVDLEATKTRMALVEKNTFLLVPRVENLEKSIYESNSSAAKTDSVLSEIRSDIATLRATQISVGQSNEKNFDRIFRKLDTLTPAR